MGEVRTILWKHLQQVHGGDAELHIDPNHPTDAAAFVKQLETLSRRDQGALAASYIQLWKRSFRTLAKQLRGRPEYAVRLFCHEIYPFLTNDRLAGRADWVGPREALVQLDDGLPEAYRHGLLHAFLELTGATVTLCPEAKGTKIRYQVASTDRAARLARDLTVLRIPLLLTALAAAALGLRASGDLTWWNWLILPGALAIQSGANAFQDLRSPHYRSLAPRQAPRWWTWFQMIGSDLVAIAIGLFIALQVGWHIGYFALAGLLIGYAYPHLRNLGLGPLVAAIVYGPLMVFAAAYSTGATGSWYLLLQSLPLGGLAGALLFIDDLAERPLDEAAGKRTLAVRLPRAQHFIGYAALVLLSLALALGQGWLTPYRYLYVIPLAASVPILLRVQANMDDHHGLAPARLATLGLHQLTAIILLL